MIQIRKSAERGKFNFGWLDTSHTFSFGEYHDPNFMGFGPLRVINEDFVAGGRGFDTHPHKNMEIITYVLDGELAHKDSLGSGSVIRPGDVQVMTAGTGIRHSEYNPSPDKTAHLLQIWLMPDEQGLTPRYDQKTIMADGKHGTLQLLVSNDGRDGSLMIHQDADLYAAKLKQDDKLAYDILRDRAWVQVTRGSIELNGQKLSQGDGAAIVDEKRLQLASLANDSEILLFDLPH